MRVDVDQSRIHLEIEHIRAEAPVEEHILVGQPRGARDQLVAHIAAVQKCELKIGLAARERRQCEPPGQSKTLDVVAQLDDVSGEILAAELRHPRQTLCRGGRRRQAPHGLAVVYQGEADLEARQRQPLEHAQHVLIFGRLGAQKLAARRNIEEQIAHFDAGSGRMGRRRRGAQRFPRALRRSRHGRPASIARSATGATRTRCSAAPRRETPSVATRSRSWSEAILLVACRESARPISCGVNPDPVVAHADEAAAAALELHFDALRARIERVLHQLLDHGGRPLDHLAGRDLIDEFVGKNLNGQGEPRELLIFAQRPSRGESLTSPPGRHAFVSRAGRQACG